MQKSEISQLLKVISTESNKVLIIFKEFLKGTSH